MKKNFKYYVIAWAILLVLFNAISIFVPGWDTLEKTTPSFWIGYCFINASFVGHLICAYMAFKEESLKKVFYNLSLFSISCGGLAVSFVVGLICMIISPLPYWIGAVVCPLVLILNVVAVLKAQAAIELVSDVDEKVEGATAFIYDMRDKSESLLARAKDEDVKSACKKVRDAFKYSDPMSSAELKSVEDEINKHFEFFKDAVLNSRQDEINAESDEVCALISERNNKCKRSK